MQAQRVRRRGMYVRRNACLAADRKSMSAVMFGPKHDNVPCFGDVTVAVIEAAKPDPSEETDSRAAHSTNQGVHHEEDLSLTAGNGCGHDVVLRQRHFLQHRRSARR